MCELKLIPYFLTKQVILGYRSFGIPVAWRAAVISLEILCEVKEAQSAKQSEELKLMYKNQSAL